jgi:N-acetylmuramoyl-L-alanine amidase
VRRALAACAAAALWLGDPRPGAPQPADAARTAAPQPADAARTAALQPAEAVSTAAELAADPAAAERAAADSARVPAGLGVPSIAVSEVDGSPVVGANDLARLLGAARSWRADVRKLVLVSGEHRLTFTDGNPFVIADDRTLRLSRDVFSRGGELLIPVDLARALPDDSGWPRLGHDARAGVLRAAPAAGYVGSPRVVAQAGATELLIPTEHPELARVVGRGRSRFQLRLRGAFVGALPDSLPDDGLVRDLRVSSMPTGLTFELAVDPAASGWRFARAPGGDAVSVTLVRGVAGWEPFAPETPPGARSLRTVVLDPGHGGNDKGVESDGVLEKTLTLDLARVLADELRRRAGARVTLTRTDDRDLGQLGRAELANRPDPDVVISLHFGMSLDPRARGGSAWCAPASLPAATLDAPGATVVTSDRAGAPGLLELLPWRDAATSHAVESRDLAEDLAAALERDGFGPMSVRERMPMGLVGVTAPGVMLECGTLSDATERGRILAPNGLRRLATAIADGLIAWQRGE